MSYIFDALKKSDSKRRQQFGGEKMYAPQPRLPRPVQEERPMRWWLLLGLIAVLIAAFGLFLHLRSISSLSSPSAADSAGPGLPEPPAQQPRPVTAAEKPVPAPASDENSRVPSTMPPAAEADPSPAATDVPELQPAPMKVPVESAAPSLASAAPPSNPQAKEPTAEAVPAIPFVDDLDPLIRRTIPEFHLAGHVYSDAPQLRMIIINNSVVRENDVVEQGYILEEIAADSVILRRDELRFRLPVD